MKAAAALIVLASTLIPCALADTSCTHSNAIPWSDTTSSSSGSSGSSSGSSGSSSGSSVDACNGDATCLALALEGQCMAAGGCAGDPSGLIKRDTFSCSSGDICMSNPVDNGLFCINADTGSYYDETGGVGNVIAGTYTSGSAGYASSSAYASSTRSSSKATATTGTSSTRTSSNTLSTSTRAAVASTAASASSSSVASTTSAASAAAATTATSSSGSTTKSNSASHLEIGAAAMVGIFAMAYGLLQ